MLHSATSYILQFPLSVGKKGFMLVWRWRNQWQANLGCRLSWDTHLHFWWNAELYSRCIWVKFYTLWKRLEWRSLSHHLLGWSDKVHSSPSITDIFTEGCAMTPWKMLKSLNRNLIGRYANKEWWSGAVPTSPWFAIAECIISPEETGKHEWF